MSPLSFEQIEMDNVKHIQELVEEKLKEVGGFLVDVKIQPNKKILVHVDKEEGIKISDCVAISRYLESNLENSGLLESHELEVSSPGLDQPLKVLKQYQKYTGKKIQVVTSDGIEKKGNLLSVNNEGIELNEIIIKKENKKRIEETINKFIPFNQIKETKIVVSF